MSVPESQCKEPTWFENLAVGDLFFDYKDNLYIKIKAMRQMSNRNEVDNCVLIGRGDSGALCFAGSDEFVREITHLYIEPETEEERDEEHS